MSGSAIGKQSLLPDGIWERFNGDMLKQDRADAEMQTRILLEEAIDEALKLLYRDFSPEECWDIIKASLQ